MVITITPDGEVQSLHRDGMPLWFLGKVSVERASSIMFNEDTQRWDIHIHCDHGAKFTCEDLSSIDGYDLARRVEVAWLDQVRLHGLDVSSEEALGRLRSIRRSIGA